MRLWVGLTSLDVRGRAAEEGAGGVSQAGAARAGTGGDRQEPRPTRSRHRPELAAPLATHSLRASLYSNMVSLTLSVFL